MFKRTPKIPFGNISILVQAIKAYIITLHKIFGEEYKRSNTYSQKKANKDEKHKV